MIIIPNKKSRELYKSKHVYKIKRNNKEEFNVFFVYNENIDDEREISL